MQNRYLDFLIDPSFEGVDIHFVLSFQDENGSIIYKQCYFPTVEIKNYNFMIDGRNLFHKPMKNDNIRKNATGQGNGYTNGCLLDCFYFKKYYN